MANSMKATESMGRFFNLNPIRNIIRTGRDFSLNPRRSIIFRDWWMKTAHEDVDGRWKFGRLNGRREDDRIIGCTRPSSKEMCT